MPTLYIIATPIGNSEDISLRAMRLFKELTVLACEDTRVTKKLFSKFDITLPQTMFSYHEHNEKAAGPKIMGFLENNIDVGICSDGGCPGISDPGYRIINEAFESGYTIEVIPGPCAVETALLASGMPTSSYTFLGFTPPKSGKRQNFLTAEKESPHTMVIYESPYRVGKLLADAREVLENRLCAVCIELTKKFQKVHRGWLYDLADEFADRKVKGEVVVVIAGNNKKFIAE